MDSAAAAWKELTLGSDGESDVNSQEEELWIEVSLSAPNAALARHFSSIFSTLEGLFAKDISFKCLDLILT